jgi:hypothetical protein
MASPIARAFADLRFALLPPRLAAGDVVEVRVPLAYGARLSASHIPCVPAGTRGIVRAVAPMPGAPGGAILDLLDMAGRPSGYWTGCSTSDLRRLTD